MSWEMLTVNPYMLATCRECFQTKNVSFSSTMVWYPGGTPLPKRQFVTCKSLLQCRFFHCSALSASVAEMDRRVAYVAPKSWEEVVEVGLGVARVVLGDEPRRDPRPWVRGSEGELQTLIRPFLPLLPPNGKQSPWRILKKRLKAMNGRNISDDWGREMGSCLIVFGRSSLRILQWMLFGEALPPLMSSMQL